MRREGMNPVISEYNIEHMYLFFYATCDIMYSVVEMYLCVYVD